MHFSIVEIDIIFLLLKYAPTATVLATLWLPTLDANSVMGIFKTSRRLEVALQSAKEELTKRSPLFLIESLNWSPLFFKEKRIMRGSLTPNTMTSSGTGQKQMEVSFVYTFGQGIKFKIAGFQAFQVKRRTFWKEIITNILKRAAAFLNKIILRLQD